jgi:hypothetical protein
MTWCLTSWITELTRLVLSVKQPVHLFLCQVVDVSITFVITVYYNARFENSYF